MRVATVQRGSALASGTLLALSALGQGHPALAGGLALLAGAWAGPKRLPARWRARLNTAALGLNAAALVLPASQARFVPLLLPAALGSLLAWNATLFSLRWPQAPPAAQRAYLRRVGGVLGLGTALAASALLLRGRLQLTFPLALGLALAVGWLWLRTLSRSPGVNDV